MLAGAVQNDLAHCDMLTGPVHTDLTPVSVITSSAAEGLRVGVRNGRLLGLLGQPCRAGDVTFRPALVEIDDPTDCHPLSEFHRPTMLAFGDFELMDVTDVPDALWVRARLPGLFSYRPLQIAEGRPYLLNAGFVAAWVEPGAGIVACPFAVTDEACGYARLAVSAAEPAGIRESIAVGFWGLLAERGVAQDFRAEGLEWYAAFDEGGLDPVEVLWEVGLSGGVYYAESVAHDHRFDPDFSRPDRSWHRYRCRPSQPRRRTSKRP
jgi:hypothetical protein